jgi:hypothetical protein
MATVSLTGNDTISISGYTLTSFADGDNATITFPNELFKVKTGKNGNSIFAFDNTGKQCDVTLRIMRGSDDDIYLNSLAAQMEFAPEFFVLLTGTFIKRIGDGLGLISIDTYILGGGVIIKKPEFKSNAEGDTDQSLAVWTLRFTNNRRAVM